MHIGISSACFYPTVTEKAVETLGQNGINEIEIFFNSNSELQAPVLTQLKQILDAYDMSVSAIHPFTSASESYMLFGNYERRFRDSIDFYKQYFEAAQYLEAPYLIIHGAHSSHQVNPDFYYQRFGDLIHAAKPFNVLPIQENVVHFMSESYDFLVGMRDALRKDFAMVLDTKQCLRCNVSPSLLVETFGEQIVHLHLSDYSHVSDCMPPGQGVFDFYSLLEQVTWYNKDVSAVVELYSKNFHTIDELIEAKEYLESLVG